MDISTESQTEICLKRHEEYPQNSKYTGFVRNVHEGFGSREKRKETLKVMNHRSSTYTNPYLMKRVVDVVK